ncbi:MAG TPA: hypothetical protein VM261_27175 [Kofleriaceae bacterium]|nr:hypothetical protein [Kofleriaceae bacterium]
MRGAAVVVCALSAAVAAACEDGGGDDDGPDVVPPQLVLAPVLPVPYVAAGMGPSTGEFTVTNPSTDGTDLTWQLAGDPSFMFVSTPDRVLGGGTVTFRVIWTGAFEPEIASATLMVQSHAGIQTAELWAVAGNAALPPATFAPVMATGRAGGATPPVIGASAVVVMPTAPFPSSGQPWTDGRVHIFVPEGYHQRDAHDVVLIFHGHSTTIDASVPAHRYREQLYASGTDAILVVPQGPVNAASGNFGKLMDPAATAAFLDEVMTVLYRAELITRPVVGDVVLTSHSGGYQAVAANLDPAATFAVPQVNLYDSLYGFLPTYRDFVVGGGRLRSNYTSGGGTDANNLSLASTLSGMNVTVASAPTVTAMRDSRALIYFTAASHNGSTRDDAAFAEQLRWSRLPGRHGPRAELRTATSTGGVAALTWRAPPDPDLEGWSVEISANDGVDWVSVAHTTRDAVAATFASTSAMRVRLVPIMAWRPDPDVRPSDAYVIAPAADILVVDGFDRVVDGSWSGLSHELAARVGAAAGNVHTVTNEAITEDSFAMTPYRVVIWLVGDDSTEDHTFTAAERAAIDAYLAGGGHVILSGSEIGYELGPTTAGAQWLASVAGAVHATDDADLSSAAGAGALAAVPSFAFGGDAAPYTEEFPDTFTPTGSGAVILRYGAAGPAAAVGIAGRAAIVGFPLETIEEPAQLDAVVDALVDFVTP